MIKINLLSPSDKLDAKWERVNRAIITTTAAVVAVQLIFIFSLFVSFEYLKVKEGKINEELKNVQLGAEAKEIKQMKKKVYDYEDQLKQIARIQRSQKRWTPVLIEFSKLVPDGVKVESFAIRSEGGVEGYDKRFKKKKKKKADQPAKYIATITGIARKREDLLEFEENLRNSRFFSNLVTYDSNYIKAKNANFKYDVEVEVENRGK